MINKKKQLVIEHNTQTNEILEREMTAAEFKDYEADEAAQAIIKAQAEANATARIALLERLGITAEEAALLLG